MRVLFYGTPEFALATLDALIARHQVVAVVTQPDRPAHRGQKVTKPPVKERALGAGLPVVQPTRLRDPGWPAELAQFGAEVAVVVAFGQILPRAILDVPRRGSINVHASLLPRYRGAAPIAWAVIRGETVTGITTFKMDEGMDTGAMLLQASTPIGPDETAGELAARLSKLGAEVIIDTLLRLDTLTPRPQRHDEATLAPRLKKSDGHLDWQRPARELANLIRGVNPWPGAITGTPRGPLTIWRGTAIAGVERGTAPASGPDGEAARAPHEPGTLVAHERTLAIATGDGLLVPREVQPENRRAIEWADYLRGARLEAGARFSAP